MTATVTTPPAVRDPFLASAPSVPVAEVTQERMWVTPELAREWMFINTVNRKTYPAHITKMARDMAAKPSRWAYNGETVKRATDGGILDGQHRLLACMEAEEPFETLVVSGLPPEAQKTVDIGANRQMKDHLSLDAEKNAFILGAVIRWGLIWVRGHRGKPSRDAEPTHAEQLEFFAAPGVQVRLREAADFASKARGDFRPILPRVFGMAYLLFTGVNDIEARVFLGRLRDGADIGVGHPVHTLRKRLQKEKDDDTRLNEWEQLALVIIAWNHFRDEETVKKLQYPKGGLTPKSFPEPR